MASSGARIFKQGAFGDSFRRQPVGSSLQLILEAFPEIDNVKKFVSDKVAALTSSDADEELSRDAQQRLEAERSEALWAVKQFCKVYPTTSIDPSVAELDELCRRCEKFQPSAVTNAISDQLARGWSGAELDWQPQFRALRLLEYLRARPGAVGAAARATVAELQQLLHFLAAEAPQFHGIACRLLRTRARPLQSGMLEPSFRATPYDAVDDPLKLRDQSGRNEQALRYGTAAPDVLCSDEPLHDDFLQDFGQCSDQPLKVPEETASQPSTEVEFEIDRVLSEVESDSQPEFEQPLPAIPKTQGIVGHSCIVEGLSVQAPGAGRGVGDKERPYLWLSSVETVAMEAVQDPFGNVVDMTSAQPL